MPSFDVSQLREYSTCSFSYANLGSEHKSIQSFHAVMDGLDETAIKAFYTQFHKIGPRGVLTAHQFRHHFAHNIVEGVSPTDADLWFSMMDTNADGFLTWSEFTEYLMRKRTISSVDLRKLFHFSLRDTKSAEGDSVVHTDMINDVHFHHNTNTFISVGDDGVIAGWSADDLHHQYSFHSGSRLTTGSCLTFNEKYLLATCMEKVVNIYYIDPAAPDKPPTIVRRICGGKASFARRAQMRAGTDLAANSRSEDITEDSEIEQEVVKERENTVSSKTFAQLRPHEHTTFVDWTSPANHALNIPTQSTFFESLLLFGDPAGTVTSFPLHGMTSLKYPTEVHSLGRLQPHNDGVSAMVYCPVLSPDCVLTSSYDGTLAINDLHQMSTVRTYSSPEVSKRIYSTAWCGEMRSILTGGVREIVVWNPHQSKAVSTLKGYKAPIIGIAMNEVEGQAITVSKDKIIKIWDLRTMRVFQTVTDTRTHVPEDAYTKLVYNERHNHIITASSVLQMFAMSCIGTVNIPDAPPPERAPRHKSFSISGFLPGRSSEEIEYDEEEEKIIPVVVEPIAATRTHTYTAAHTQPIVAMIYNTVFHHVVSLDPLVLNVWDSSGEHLSSISSFGGEMGSEYQHDEECRACAACFDPSQRILYIVLANMSCVALNYLSGVALRNVTLGVPSELALPTAICGIAKDLHVGHCNYCAFALGKVYTWVYDVSPTSKESTQPDVSVWKSTDSKLSREFKRHMDSEVTSVYAVNGCAFAGTASGSIRVHNIHSGTLLNVMYIKPHQASLLRQSVSGEYRAASKQGMRVMSLSEGEVEETKLASIIGEDTEAVLGVECLAYLHTKELIVSVMGNRFIYIWGDLFRRSRLLFVFDGQVFLDRNFFQICTTPSGMVIASSDDCGRVYVYNCSRLPHGNGDAKELSNVDPSAITLVSHFRAHSGLVTHIIACSCKGVDVVITFGSDLQLLIHTQNGILIGAFGQFNSWSMSDWGTWVHTRATATAAAKRVKETVRLQPVRTTSPIYRSREPIAVQRQFSMSAPLPLTSRQQSILHELDHHETVAASRSKRDAMRNALRRVSAYKREKPPPEIPELTKLGLPQSNRTLARERLLAHVPLVYKRIDQATAARKPLPAVVQPLVVAPLNVYERHKFKGERSVFFEDDMSMRVTDSSLVADTVMATDDLAHSPFDFRRSVIEQTASNGSSYLDMLRVSTKRLMSFASPCSELFANLKATSEVIEITSSAHANAGDNQEVEQHHQDESHRSHEDFQYTIPVHEEIPPDRLNPRRLTALRPEMRAHYLLMRPVSLLQVKHVSRVSQPTLKTWSQQQMNEFDREIERDTRLGLIDTLKANPPSILVGCTSLQASKKKLKDDDAYP